MKISAYDMYIYNYHLSALALVDMFKNSNIKVKSFPKEVMDELKKVNKELRVEIAKKSPVLKEVFHSQEAYQKKAREWTKMSDYLYLKDNL